MFARFPKSGVTLFARFAKPDAALGLAPRQGTISGAQKIQNRIERTLFARSPKSGVTLFARFPKPDATLGLAPRHHQRRAENTE